MYRLIFYSVLAIIVLLYFYVLGRARRAFGFRWPVTLVISLLAAAGPPLLIYGKRGVPGELGVCMSVAGASIVLGVALAGVFLIHVDVGRVALRLVMAVARKLGLVKVVGREPKGHDASSKTLEASGSLAPPVIELSELEGELDGANAPAEIDRTHAPSAGMTPGIGAEHRESSKEGDLKEKGRPWSEIKRDTEKPERFALTRREALVSGAAILAGPTASTYASVLGRSDYDSSETVLRVPGWPAALEGFSIVQLSDIHIGQFVGDDELNDAVSLVRAAGADLIVMTGDLLDHDAQFAPKLGELTRKLEPLARFGVAAVPGNHDHYAGIESALAALRGGGARVLMNEGVVIGAEGPGATAGQGFALLGVDDLWARRRGFGPDLDRAISQVPADLPRVLLCHQPEFFYDNAGAIQVQLSGHTHGGQVGIGYDASRLVLPHGYVKGRYERNGGQLFVNRGFGTAGPPARLGSPPEVAKLILVGA